MKEKVLKRFGLTVEQAQYVKLWAFNQGFYNLFLAFGLFYSLWVADSHGLFLSRYLLAFIVGAGLVLMASSPKKYVAALIQALPALIALIASFY